MTPPDTATVGQGRSLRILLLCDDQRAHATTVLDHIRAFSRYSRHRVIRLNPRFGGWPRDFDLDRFDAVVIHYSLCVIFDTYLPAAAAEAIRRFRGLKVQFIQDEHRWVHRMLGRMEELGIDLLFSCVPESEVEKLYGRLRAKGMRVTATLTGYVPTSTERRTPPIAERPLHVAYRGRRLPFWMGDLSQEKDWIAGEFLRRVEGRGLRCDASSDERARIYGKRWPRFLLSAKACLGTESGATIADFDGEVERGVTRYLDTHPGASYRQVAEAVLHPFEGNVRITAISPRAFEAISLRTAMVLFPGSYSGVIAPHRHYLPLEKDFANLDEVVGRLHDDAFLQQMVDRAHAEIVGPELYSYRRFIAGFDETVAIEWRRRVGAGTTAGWQAPATSTVAGTATGAETDPGSTHARRTREVLQDEWIRRQIRGRRVWAWMLGRFSGIRRSLRAAVRRRLSSDHLRMLVSAAFIVASHRTVRAPIARAALIEPRLSWRQRRSLCHQLLLLAGAHRMVTAAASGTVSCQCSIECRDHRLVVHVYPPPAAPAADRGALLTRASITDALAAGRVDVVTFRYHDAAAMRSWPYLAAPDGCEIRLDQELFRRRPRLVADLLAERIVEGRGRTAGPRERPWRRTWRQRRHLALARITFVLARHAPRFLEPLARVHAYVSGGDVTEPFRAKGDRSRSAVPAIVARRSTERRSVAFLHACYYNFYYLAAALRRRGWDAVSLTLHDPNSQEATFFHGQDWSLYDPDPRGFALNQREAFETVKRRFAMVHFYGRGVMSFFPANWDVSAHYERVPWDFLDLKRQGIKIGFSHSGCNDLVSQSSFNRWSGGACLKCPWRSRPDICSDTRNRAWGRKVREMCDLICVEADVMLDDKNGPAVYREPLTLALDPEFWRPDLPIPEEWRRPRVDGEVVIHHAVGNYSERTTAGRNFKGTHAIVAAVEELRHRGYKVRLDFVTDVPSLQMRYAQVQADIVVEQLNYGRYGATAREAMMLGRPVVAYINPSEPVPSSESQCIRETPVVSATEETIVEVLEALVVSEERRRSIGIASRAHALKWWSADACAERYERVYDRLMAGQRPTGLSGATTQIRPDRV